MGFYLPKPKTDTVDVLGYRKDQTRRSQACMAFAFSEYSQKSANFVEPLLAKTRKSKEELSWSTWLSGE